MYDASQPSVPQLPVIPLRYLELADWDLKEEIQSAKEDREWEKEEAQNDELKSGQIGVSIRYKGGKPLVDLKGIGKSTKDTPPKVSSEARSSPNKK